MNKKFNNFLKTYYIYQGTSDELIFYVLIDTLFLTLKKGLIPEQISYLVSISLIVSLFFRFVSYKIIKRVGNAKALVIAACMFLGAACFFTFGNSLFALGLGQILYTSAPLLQDASGLFLKDQLEHFGEKQRFVTVMSTANTIYALITLITACISGKLFAINGYLPMYLCIGFCINSLILSIILAKNEIPRNNKPIIIPGRQTTVFNGAITKCIILLSINSVILSVATTNFKLLFQSRLQSTFPEEIVIYLFSALIILTRIVKLISNAIMRRTKITDKLNEKILIRLSALLLIAFILTLSGYYMSFIMSACMVAIGMLAINISFDPIRTILTYYLLNKTTNKNGQLIISSLSFIKSLLVTIASLIVSIILAIFQSNLELYSVVIFFIIIATIMFILCVIWRSKIHCINSSFSYYNLEKYLNKFDSLKLTIAFLAKHYGFLKKEKEEQLITKSNEILQLKKQDSYNYIQLKQEYMNGHPCAVEIIVNGENMWMPVIFLDDDDVIVANFKNQQLGFLSELNNVVNMCSFSKNPSSH